MKCATENCTYYTNTNIKNNGGKYCCRSCKTDGSHGLFCERRPLEKIIKIAVVGTKQSGSTRLFNLLIMLYTHLNKKVYSTYQYCHNKDNLYDIVINKCHNSPIEDLNNYNFVLSPVRHLFDSAISAIKRGFQKDYIKACHHNINLFNKFEHKADFVFIYEKYSLDYIKDLCKLLNINIEDRVLIEIMQKLEDLHNSKTIVKTDNKNNELYKRTLLSQSHNTSGGRINKFLTEMSRETIERLLKDEKINAFLKKLNYI
jgi:hypothetical protein